MKSETRSGTHLRILIEGALFIAFATVLSYVKLFDMPFGGSITLEMLPLVIMALRNGVKWGCLTGFVHGLIQMIIGFSNVLYCNTFIAQIGCVLLDYIVAFTVLGLAPFFAGCAGKNRKAGFLIGSVAAGLLRFLCSFLSGCLLWGSYAPEGMNVVLYSFLYNGAYMVPDIIILAAVVLVLEEKVPKLFPKAYMYR